MCEIRGFLKRQMGVEFMGAAVPGGEKRQLRWGLPVLSTVSGTVLWGPLL